MMKNPSQRVVLNDFILKVWTGDLSARYRVKQRDKRKASEMFCRATTFFARALAQQPNVHFSETNHFFRKITSRIKVRNNARF